MLRTHVKVSQIGLLQIVIVVVTTMLVTTLLQPCW